MLWSWLKRRRRLTLTREPFPAAWAAHIERNVEHYAALSADEQAELTGIVQVLLAEKHWEGCGGLTLTDEMRVTIAAQAGLLLLGLEHDYYRNVLSILVYPAGYALPRGQPGADGSIVSDAFVPVLGQAEIRGPLIVSWRDARHGGADARDGRNLVYHEFAHKLDMLDGLVDGTPNLDREEELAQWVAVMTEAFERLRKQAEQGRRTLLDPYGTTNPGEFFAVATEAFFEQPVKLRERHPKLYSVLRDFYGQDVAERLGGARRRKRARR